MCIKNSKVDGILALVGGFCLHLTLGTLYCFGNMNTYMTSYLRKHVNPKLVYSDMIWIPTLAVVGQGLFMTCSGHLEERIGVRFTLLLGSFVMTSGVYLTSLSIKYSLVLTIITYGFMFGLGTALAYAPPLGVAMKWYPRKKGLVNGVIVGGFGLGAFIFNQIQSLYLNPHNKPLDDDGYFSDDSVLNRVPSVFLLLGSIYGTIQALSILIISAPEDIEDGSNMPLVTHAIDDTDEEDEELLNNSGDAFNTSGQVTLEDEENLKPGQIVKSREFWILWATFFLNTQAITYINSNYKVFGQSFINDDHFLAIVGAVAAVFNSGGRIFWGYLCDHFGYRNCMFLATLAMGSFYASLYWVDVGGKAMFAVWIWGIFFSFCASFVLLPTASAQSFGTK
jgi:MFS family permease